MRKFLTFLSKTIAVFFAVLFVITAVLVILLFNLERKMFSATLYKSALADQQIYERLPEIVGTLLTTSISYNPCAENPLLCEEIPDELRACYIQKLGQERYVALASGQEKPTEAEMQAIQPCLDKYGSETTPATGEQPSGESPNQGGMPPFMKNLKASDWGAILSILVPPNEMKVMTENILDQVFAYLNGETDSASISLVTLKERLAGQAGKDAILQLLAAQPPCTEEQLTKMFVGAPGEGEGMVMCAPPAETLNLIMLQLQNQLTALVAQIPDKAVIIEPSTPSSPASDGGPLGSDPIATLRTVRLALRLSPLLPLGLLLLVTLFGVRTLKGWMRWWGIPFFFAGAIALVPGAAAKPALNWAWYNFVISRIPPIITTEITDIGHNLAVYIVHSLSEQIILQSLILLVIGLAAWIGSYFIKVKVKPQAPAAPPAPGT